MVVVRQFRKILPPVLLLLPVCGFLYAAGPLTGLAGGNDGKIPQKSIVRLFLSKDSDVFIGGQLVTGSKVHEVVEFRGVILSRDGYVVSYVGNYLPELAVPDVKTSIETWQGDRVEAWPVGVDERLALIFLKSDLSDEAIPLSSEEKPAYFNIVSVGPAGWVIARPCLYGWQQKQAILPTPKLKVSGLNLTVANWQGGIVIDLNGALVGLVTDTSPHLTSKNLSYFYMIPALAIEAAYTRVLKEKRDLLAGWLGVFLEEEGQHLEVTQVVPNSPAESGGLQEGDRILKMDGVEIEGLEEFSQAIRWRGPGKKARVTIERDGRIDHLELTLTTRPRENLGWRVSLPDPGSSPQGNGRMRIYRTRIPPLLEFGLVIEALNRRMASEMKALKQGGLLVQQVRDGSRAESGGLRVGDIIVQIDGHAISDVREFEWALLETRGSLAVELIRDGKRLELSLDPAKKIKK